MSEYVLPTLLFYANLDRNVVFTRLSGVLDFTAWSTIEVRIPGLSIVRSLAGAHITVNSADQITVSFPTSLWTNKTAGGYDYQIVVGTGAANYAVPLGKGRANLRAALA